MRHGKKIAKLGRTAPHRKAMLANMMASLFINERVTTTQTRAKELKRVAERVLTCAKQGDLHAGVKCCASSPTSKWLPSSLTSWVRATKAATAAIRA